MAWVRRSLVQNLNRWALDSAIQRDLSGQSKLLPSLSLALTSFIRQMKSEHEGQHGRPVFPGVRTRSRRPLMRDTEFR